MQLRRIFGADVVQSVDAADAADRRRQTAQVGQTHVIVWAHHA